MPAKDYYAELGVSKTASKDEIRKAYRRLARKLHPDIQGGGDAERFKVVTKAYEVLSDNLKRVEYDSPPHRPIENIYQQWDFFGRTFSVFPGFMSSFGNGPTFVDSMRPEIRTSITVPMDKAYSGFRSVVRFDRHIECGACSGKGVISSDKTECPQCKGVSTSGFQRCQMCSGSGRIRTICQTCGGAGRSREVSQAEISVPPRTMAGSVVTVSGAGNRMANGSKGDLLVRVAYQLEQDGVHCLQDGTLTMSIFVPWDAALLGEKHNFRVFSSCSSEVVVSLVPSLPNEGEMRLKGLGMGGSDLLIKVWYTLPSNIHQGDREIIARAIRNAKSETERRQDTDGQGCP